MRPHLLWFPVLALGAASCLTPVGYYRDQNDAGGQGGASPTGGAPGTGGATSTGGVRATGGTTATGGVTGTGGVIATGGVTAAGGVRATGGTTGAAGGASSGSMLLAESFETGASQWITSGPGTATIKMDGSNVYDLADPMSKVFLAAAGDVAWTNVIVTAKVKILSWAGSSSSDYAGICARLADVDNYTCLALRGDTKVALREDVGGSSSSVGNSVSASLTTGTWYTVTLEINGNNVTASLNGTMVLPRAGDAAAAPGSANGGIALVVDNAEAEFDDVTVTVP